MSRQFREIGAPKLVQNGSEMGGRILASRQNPFAIFLVRILVRIWVRISGKISGRISGGSHFGEQPF